MATITPPRVTPEDLLSITDRPMPELVDGEMVERHMGQKSDLIAARILILLGSCVFSHRLGWVNGAQGSYQIFPGDPAKVRIPDGSFTRLDRLPDGPVEGHGRVAPDLVFEVVSPNDVAEDLERKIVDFFAAGVRLIWVVHPGSQIIQVWRQDGSGRWFKDGDVLDGEDVLPGFRCEVAAIFE